MSQNNEKYMYVGPLRATIGKEAFKREYDQRCMPDDSTQMFHTDDPTYDPFKWSRIRKQENQKCNEKSQLEQLTQLLERIEKKVDKLIGPQLINGIWR